MGREGRKTKRRNLKRIKIGRSKLLQFIKRKNNNVEANKESNLGRKREEKEKQRKKKKKRTK